MMARRVLEIPVIVYVVRNVLHTGLLFFRGCRGLLGTWRQRDVSYPTDGIASILTSSDDGKATSSSETFGPRCTLIFVSVAIAWLECRKPGRVNYYVTLIFDVMTFMTAATSWVVDVWMRGRKWTDHFVVEFITAFSIDGIAGSIDMSEQRWIDFVERLVSVLSCERRMSRVLFIIGIYDNDVMACRVFSAVVF